MDSVIARGPSREKTPMAAQLAELLEAVRLAVAEAEPDNYSAKPKTPEAQARILKAVQDSTSAALPMLDVTFEDPVMARGLVKYLNRIKNLKKLVVRLGGAKTWDDLMAVFHDEETRSKSTYRKLWEYIQDAVGVVSHAEETQTGAFDLDGWRVILMESERGAWDRSLIEKARAAIERVDRILERGGFGSVVGGRIFAYPWQFLQGSTYARYRTDRDIVQIAVDAPNDQKALISLTHELGHRFYFRQMSSMARKAWRGFFEQETGSPGVTIDSIIRTWEAWYAAQGTAASTKDGGTEAYFDVKYGRTSAYFERYLKQHDPDMLMWLQAVMNALKIEEPVDETTGALKRNVKPGLDQLIERKSEARVFMHPVTSYSTSSAEELFAETFAHYLVLGPQRIPEPVRVAFRDATARWLRVASATPQTAAGRVAARYLAAGS